MLVKRAYMYYMLCDIPFITQNDTIFLSLKYFPIKLFQLYIHGYMFWVGTLLVCGCIRKSHIFGYASVPPLLRAFLYLLHFLYFDRSTSTFLYDLSPGKKNKPFSQISLKFWGKNNYGSIGILSRPFRGHTALQCVTQP